MKNHWSSWNYSQKMKTMNLKSNPMTTIIIMLFAWLVIGDVIRRNVSPAMSNLFYVISLAFVCWIIYIYLKNKANQKKVTEAKVIMND